MDKPAVDSFLATSSKKFGNGARFSARLWISTSDNWNAEAERAIISQNPPVLRIGLQDLQLAAVDWAKLDAGKVGEEALKNFRELEKYFRTHERGKLIMSCGTGKTYTSLRIAEKSSRTEKFCCWCRALHC